MKHAEGFCMETTLAQLLKSGVPTSAPNGFCEDIKGGEKSLAGSP